MDGAGTRLNLARTVFRLDVLFGGFIGFNRDVHSFTFFEPNNFPIFFFEHIFNSYFAIQMVGRFQNDFSLVWFVWLESLSGSSGWKEGMSFSTFAGSVTEGLSPDFDSIS
jgi:hypothetical protein